MSNDQVLGHILDRLRHNLRTAGIQATDADIQGIIEKGFLSRIVDFERVVEGMPPESVPDYLHAWGADTRADTISLPNQPKPTAGTEHGKEERRFEQVQRHASISVIAPLVQTRQVSPVELTEQVLERIDERDVELNAFQYVMADHARAVARRAEQEIATGNYRGPLHGIPVAVKDLLAMTGTPTTAGSKILADWVPDFDAAAVERFDAAGAVIVGKTRLSEFAYSPGSNNAHYGPTRNPWNSERDTGGSSSGSAAAVADGLAYAALGSDTGGSIRIPAALCGIVGLKPTFGRVSLHGVVPLSWSLDHLGPLTRSVADAALLLKVLAGYDRRDPRTRQGADGLSLTDLDAGVAGLRVGVLEDDGTGEPLCTAAALAAYRTGTAALERQGATLVPISLPELDSLRYLGAAILAMEAATYHQPMLRQRLDDFGPFMRQRVLAAFAYNAEAFVRAQQARLVIRQRCDRIFDQIDLLCTPTQPDVAPPLNRLGWTTFTLPFNVLGWPAITVPVGVSDERLPLGLQLIGKPWDEATILRAARTVEAGTRDQGILDWVSRE